MDNSIVLVDQTKTLDARLKAMREEMKALQESRKALLPRLSTEERETVLAVEAAMDVAEDAVKAVAELRKNRQLTEEDRDQVQAARMAHRKEINTPETKAGLIDALKKAYLHQARFTHRKDGTVGVTLRGTI